MARLAAAIDRRIRAFDEDARVIALGIVVGLVYALLMAVRIDRLIPQLSLAGVGLALVAPSAGVSMLATLAVVREPAGLNPIHFNASVVIACLLAAAVRFGVRGLAGHRVAIRPEFLAIAGYGALTVIQYLAVSLAVSQTRAQFGLNVLIAIIPGLALIVVVAVLFSERTRRYLLAAMVPSIILAAVLALVSLSPELLAALPVQGWLLAPGTSARGTGVFSNPNFMGEAMATGFILVTRARAVALPRLLTKWAPLLAGVIALALIASFSRGALVALAVGLVVLYAVRGRRALLRATLVAIPLTVIGAFGLLAIRHVLTFGAKIDLSGPAQAASDDARLSAMIAGLRLFRHDWKFGAGIGQFTFESVRFGAQYPVTYPHDVYIGVAAEQGLPGIVLFVTMLVAIAVALWRRRDPIAMTALAMLAAYVAGSLFADNLMSYLASAMVWITVGCGLVLGSGTGSVTAAGQPLGDAGPPRETPSRSLGPPGPVVRQSAWRSRAIRLARSKSAGLSSA